jgi:uncharacterized protein YgiM (DUF1202 family)
MELTCIYCYKPYNVNPAEAASAVIDYTFGKKTHNFVCDNCHKDNAVTKDAYYAAREAEKKPQPAAGTKPVAQPAPSWPGMQQAPVKRTAVVTVYSLHVRKDHSTRSETMAGLSKGEKVEVLNTWTDGKNTWAQIGPDRWIAMIYNGDTLAEFSE